MGTASSPAPARPRASPRGKTPRDTSSPSGPPGCASARCRGPATASGAPREAGEVREEGPDGTYSPKGTRCTFSNDATTRSARVPRPRSRCETCSTTPVRSRPTSSVVRSRRATVRQRVRLRRARQGLVERHDVLGPHARGRLVSRRMPEVAPPAGPDRRPAGGTSCRLTPRSALRPGPAPRRRVRTAARPVGSRHAHGDHSAASPGEDDSRPGGQARRRSQRRPTW